MKYCSECGSYLLANAKFCHTCGTQVLMIPMQICPSCQKENPKEVKFCSDCGFDFQKMNNIQKNLQATFAFNLDYQRVENLPMQLKACFLQYLNYALSIDGLQGAESAWQTLFHHSHFRAEYFEEALLQWTAKIEEIVAQSSFTAIYDIEELLLANFQKAYHYLLVAYGKDLLPSPLSNDILPYWDATQIPVALLIKDYLKTEQEGHLLLYNNALQIPLAALQQAQEQFFFAKSTSEMPLIFVDQSLLQTGAQGLILTSQGIYWKAPFHVAAHFEYKAIESLKYTAKGIYINAKYLNVERGFNFKLFKLLQFLKKKLV